MSFIHGGDSIFAHSRANALRGKFCSDKSSQNLKPRKYYLCHYLSPNYEGVIINVVAAGFSLRRNGKDKRNASYPKPRSALGGLKVAATPFHGLGYV